MAENEKNSTLYRSTITLVIVTISFYFSADYIQLISLVNLNHLLQTKDILLIFLKPIQLGFGRSVFVPTSHVFVCIIAFFYQIDRNIPHNTIPLIHYYLN